MAVRMTKMVKWLPRGHWWTTGHLNEKKKHSSKHNKYRSVVDCRFQTDEPCTQKRLRRPIALSVCMAHLGLNVASSEWIALYPTFYGRLYKRYRTFLFIIKNKNKTSWAEMMSNIQCSFPFSIRCQRKRAVLLIPVYRRRHRRIECGTANAVPLLKGGTPSTGICHVTFLPRFCCNLCNNCPHC